jgi:hypothetical protein
MKWQAGVSGLHETRLNNGLARWANLKLAHLTNDPRRVAHFSRLEVDTIYGFESEHDALTEDAAQKGRRMRSPALIRRSFSARSSGSFQRNSPVELVVPSRMAKL